MRSLFITLLLTLSFSTYAIDLANLTRVDIEPELCNVAKVIEILPNELTDRVLKVNTAILSIATQLEVDPCLILSITWAESTFKASQLSFKGARGLMQVKPSTKAEVVHKVGYELNKMVTSNLDKGLTGKELENLIVGSHYIKYLKKKFKNSNKAIMAYNIGPANVIYGRQLDAGMRYLNKINLKLQLVTVNN